MDQALVESELSSVMVAGPHERTDAHLLEGRLLPFTGHALPRSGTCRSAFRDLTQRSAALGQAR